MRSVRLALCGRHRRDQQYQEACNPDGYSSHHGPKRRTWVEPPEGYVPGSDPLEQVVEVVKDRTTQVEFTLVRTP